MLIIIFFAFGRPGSSVSFTPRCVCKRVDVCVVFITHCVWCYPQLITISCNLQRSLDPAQEQLQVGLAKGTVMTQVTALLYIYA